jgi:hypothetical protein
MSQQLFEELLQVIEKKLGTGLPIMETLVEKGEKEVSMYLSEKDALEIVKEQIAKLKKKKKVREFCISHQINPNSLSSIMNMEKNGKGNVAPKMILSILKIFFKEAELKTETYYLVKKVINPKNILE